MGVAAPSPPAPQAPPWQRKWLDRPCLSCQQAPLPSLGQGVDTLLLPFIYFTPHLCCSGLISQLQQTALCQVVSHAVYHRVLCWHVLLCVAVLRLPACLRVPQASRLFKQLTDLGPEALVKGGLDFKKVAMHGKFCADTLPKVCVRNNAFVF